MASKFRVSYAQMGEDVVVHGLLKSIPTSYVDIGSNHPIYGNNTYYFYLRGARGICVDPNDRFASLYAIARSRDEFIAAAVTSSNRQRVRLIKSGGSTDWFVSFDDNRHLARSEEVSNIHINEVLRRSGSPNIGLLSIDIEAMTADLLEALDFNRFNIATICVEADKSPEERRRIFGVLEANGYALSACNPINLIFSKI
jgi:hypothetical protein